MVAVQEALGRAQVASRPVFELLKLKGALRPADRHAGLVLASRASTAPALAPDIPALPAWLLAGLGGAGIRLVTAAWSRYEWAPRIRNSCARQAALPMTAKRRRMPARGRSVPAYSRRSWRSCTFRRFSNDADTADE